MLLVLDFCPCVFNIPIVEDAPMSTPLDDVDFLTRSEYRVAVLKALANEPHEYSELMDLTGVSRVTLSRMLTQLEEKNWIVENDQYEITPVGEDIAADLSTLLETTELAQDLHDVIQWVPTTTMDFDLRRLAKAEIGTVTNNEPHKPLERAFALCEPASRSLYMGNGTSVSFARMAANKTPSTDDRFEVIFSSSAIDTISDSPQSAAFHREMIEQGWDIHESEKTLPVSMGVYDSTVLILLIDENGTEQGFIESDDPVIRSWCEDTFERYRRESHPINTDTFVL